MKVNESRVRRYVYDAYAFSAVCVRENDRFGVEFTAKRVVATRCAFDFNEEEDTRRRSYVFDTARTGSYESSASWSEQ